jgi:transcriptional regulator with XRE-family HTH domain
MATSAGTPRARTLAAMLREARTKTGVSARELAKRLGITHPTIGRWESGETVPNAEDVASYLTAIGVVGDERERILSLARSHDEDDWLSSGAPGISQQLAGVMECERTAKRITEWAPLGIPGMMQTNEYARAIIGRGDSTLSRTEIETRVMLRLARRDALTRREPVEFTALVGEPAIRGGIGGRVVMADQLRQVQELSERTNVTTQVVSLAGEWHPGHPGPFILYEFDAMPAIVYLEHYRSGAFLVDEQDVRAYKAAAETIQQVALSPENTAALIADVISSLEASS